MRASSDNPELSQASGIDIEKIITYVWFIAITFASLGGILIGLETYILPYMGFAIIIPVSIALFPIAERMSVALRMPASCPA